MAELTAEPERHLIEPSVLSYQAITEYAALVGAHHAIYSARGHADLELLTEKLGGRTVKATSFTSPETLTVYAPRNFVIHVPLMCSARRKRIGAAREIGRYFLLYLHRERTEFTQFRNGVGDPKQDVQANVFAAALLLPEAQFRKAWLEEGGDSFAVARVFDVSPLAASTRAAVLNLV